MKSELKERVCKANKLLQQHGLVIFTWGNVSEIEDGIVAIKPSGVEYSLLKPEDIVLVDLNGNVIEGALKPSSDLDTHLEIYKGYSDIKGITHTHSAWAASWAQAGMDIPALGTTHADYFYGSIPCTRDLTPDEINSNYEMNIGKVIVETLSKIDINAVPGVLVKSHGSFTWGKDANDSVYYAVLLEQVAKMAYATLMLKGGACEQISQYLLDKHYFRKHGKDAYYGQEKLKD